MRLFYSFAFFLIPVIYFGQNYCEIQSIQYDVINDLGHSVGSEWWLNDEVGGWAAFVDTDNSGFLTYGPYDNSGISGLRQVTYNLLVGDNNSNNLVFTIDVWDATTGEQLVGQDVYQDWFSAGITPQSFTLSYYHTEGNSMEYRVWFHDSVTGAITGLSVTNDVDGDEACDCIGDADGDGTCDEWTYSDCGGPSNTNVQIWVNMESFSGSNYYVSEGSYTWEEANLLASDFGGHLVTINSAEENAFVQTLSSDSPWIGLYQNSNSSSYSEPDGGWEWVTGECLDYENWSDGEPNNASEMENGEAYAHMNSSGNWNDWLNDASAPFIMEVNCLTQIEVCQLPGCTDDTACNYDPTATDDDGSCTYNAPGTCDCDGNVLDAIGVCGGDCSNDYNANGICDDEDVVGCTYENASNYEPTATLDDGSCLFDDCDINEAYEEGYDAGVDSVECPEESCLGDLNLDGGVSTADLLIFLSTFGLECEDNSTFICGNGILESGEECDDGNNVPDDGCDGCLIVNTPPIVSQVVITPNAPVEGNTLVCSYTFQDVDNDIDQSTISWTVDGQSVGTGSTLTYPFTTGAVITCLVTPFDGIDTGQEVSSTVIVQ